MKRPIRSLPDGVQDLLPPQAWELERIRREVLDLFRDWGFDYIEPPLIEYLDALLVAGGQDLDLQTLKMVDQRSGRLLGVRADMTSQAARIDASHLNADGVTRLCYAGPVVHANPRGVLESRVPIKAGAELFGSPALEADAEVIALMVEVLRTLGSKRRNRHWHLCPIENCPQIFFGSRGGWDAHVASRRKHPEWHEKVDDADQRKRLFGDEFDWWFKDPAKSDEAGSDSPESIHPNPVLVLGHMGIYRALARTLELDEWDERALFAAVQSKAEADVVQMVGIQPQADLLAALPRLMGREEVLAEARSLLRKAPREALQAVDALERLATLAMRRCPEAELRFDLAELAGFGYHNGPVFAAFHGGQGQALARGGRYDGIGAAFGRARPATGFDVNLKRLLNRVPAGLEPTVWAPWAADWQQAKALSEAVRRTREAGWRVLPALGAEDLKPAGCVAHFAWRRDRWRLVKTRN